MTEQELREMKLHEIKEIEPNSDWATKQYCQRVLGGWIYYWDIRDSEVSSKIMSSIFVPDNTAIYDLISEIQTTVQFIRNKF